MRVLFLILASDGGIYTELQGVWRKYIHRYSDPIHTIRAYFYKANPRLTVDHEFDGDVIWVKCPETLDSVTHKLKMALQAIEPLLDQFDYVCRPNLSSFFILDRYLAALATLPREKACMAKEHLRPAVFPTGAGFTITPDVVRAILKHPFPQHVRGGDDVAVGGVLKDLGIKIIDVPRVDITHPTHWDARLDMIAKDPRIFHVRVKHEGAWRTEKDLAVHSRLLEAYNRA